ncbi:MAG: hypothetical protein ABIH37_03475 [archaeon]
MSGDLIERALERMRPLQVFGYPEGPCPKRDGLKCGASACNYPSDYEGCFLYHLDELRGQR